PAKPLKEGALVVFNRPIFTFRASFLGATPTQRVDAARERINVVLGRGGPGAVSVEPVPQGSMVKIDGSLAFIVTEGDIDPLEEQTTESVARDAAKALEQAIAETHEARSGEQMIRAAIWAGGATLVYFLALWLLSRVARMVTARMVGLARGLAGILRRFFERVQSGQIQVGWLDADSARPTRRLVSIAVWVFALVMAYPYIPGSDSDAFKGLSVLIGLMISVGASGIVGQ